MFLTENNNIKHIVLHKVGNKSLGGQLEISKQTFKTDNQYLKELITNFFIKPFVAKQVFYQFHDKVDLRLNKMYAISRDIFDDPEKFLNASKKIATHLYESSDHHMVKEGDLFVFYISNCVIDDVQTDAIGLVKSENKNKFIKTFLETGASDIQVDEGFDIHKVDKCCLIFNTDYESGYKICLADTLNKTFDLKYWNDTFLGIEPLKDEYYNTNAYLLLTKEFIVDQLENSKTIEKTQAIEYLNKTVDYFKENNHFIEKDFAHKVFDNQETVKSFQKYKDVFTTHNETEFYDDFVISTQAVKKSSKIFKNVIKLDKNFHVYVHGGSDLIEKGYDPKVGKNYYKIYYDTES